MTAYPYEIWDVFTDRRFAGNQLAVVTDARGLDDAAMQTITREFNFAESTFVFPPSDPAHTAKVRIFTPGYEMPFAGHPTVGTSLSIAQSRGLADQLSLELKAGLFTVRIDRGGPAPFAEFLNPNLPAERGSAPEAGLIEAALSLPAGSLDRAAHRPRRVGAGVDFYFAKASIEVVRRAAIDGAAWKKLDFKGVIGVLLYADGGDAPGTDYHVRMFAPDAGVVEDAATGSAAAALPGQLAFARALADGERRLIIEQGVEMGRPSRIESRVSVVDGAVASVHVGGRAVKVATGTLYVA